MILVMSIAGSVGILICVLLVCFWIYTKKKGNYAKVRVTHGKTSGKEDGSGSVDLLDFDSKNQATVFLKGQKHGLWISLLDVQNHSREYGFYLEDYVVVGREQAEDDHAYCILDPKLSRRHCRFSSWGEDEVWLEDLNSTNHTYINGVEIRQKWRLDQNDKITIGGSEYTFRSGRV